jgi:hypothetical protein
MFGQREGVEPFGNGCLHNLFQAVLCMSAELTRVTVMGVRHIEPETVAPKFRPLRRDWRVSDVELRRSICMRLDGNRYAGSVRLKQTAVRKCFARCVAQPCKLGKSRRARMSKQVALRRLPCRCATPCHLHDSQLRGTVVCKAS